MASMKIHLRIHRNLQPGPACSTPWVDEDGNYVAVLTTDTEQVTCLACPRTRAFARALDARSSDATTHPGHQ